MDLTTLERLDLIQIETGRWILAIAKHLKAFAASPELTSLYAVSRSARDGELLLRLRGMSSLSYTQVEAFAFDVAIPKQECHATLERIAAVTQLIEIVRGNNSVAIEGVREYILTEEEVYRATSDLFEHANPTNAERAIMPALDLLSKLPLTKEEVIDRVCALGFAEKDVLQALDIQKAFRLLESRRVEGTDSDLLFNEYLWGTRIDQLESIVVNLGSGDRDHLMSLVDEVRKSQGQPLASLVSAPPHIVRLAADTGIIDTTTIMSKSGDTRTFVFCPHFYGFHGSSELTRIEDSTDQVKLFVASIVYGSKFSIDFRLKSPIAFVGSLLRNNEAGSATPILRDYLLLERQGIIKVEERVPGRGTFVLQKRDVVQRALQVLQDGHLVDGDGANDARTLVTQKDFRSPEMNRLRRATAGQQSGSVESLQDQLIASIRDIAQDGMW